MAEIYPIRGARVIHTRDKSFHSRETRPLDEHSSLCDELIIIDTRVTQDSLDSGYEINNRLSGELTRSPTDWSKAR